MCLVFVLAVVAKAFDTLALATAVGDFTSTTFIDPQQSFVFGEGKHKGYSAKLVNQGNVAIEIFTAAEDECAESVKVLKPGEKTSVKILENTTVILKNLGQTGATIGIKISGYTNLSMGYTPNKAKKFCPLSAS